MKLPRTIHRPALILAWLFGVWIVSTSSARDYFVAQSGFGNQSGIDASDPLPLSWLNSASSWNGGAGTVVSGDTVHLVGTFTNFLNLQGSGTAGNPITVLFEPGANFTSPCWPSGTQAGGGAIELNGNSYIIIDGGTNGLIQNTACGTAFTNRASSGIAGILNHGIIRNLTITNIYLRTSYVDFMQWFEGGNCIYLLGTDLAVTNCNLSDAVGLVTIQPWHDPVNTNYVVAGNHLFNANHFVGFSLPENTVVSNVTVAGNYFDHADVWDGGGGANNLHMDYIIVIDAGMALTNAYLSGTFINNNTFGANYMANLEVITNYPGWGKKSAGVWTNATDSASHGQTAIVASYLNGQASENQNVFIFNNLILTHTNTTWGNAPLTGAGTNVWVVNNTCVALEGNNVSCGGGIQVAGGPGFAYNNICFPGYGITLTGITTNVVTGSNTATNDILILTNYLDNLWSDYNVAPADAAGLSRFGYGVGHSIAGGSPFNPLSLTTLANWQTYQNNSWGWKPPIWNATHADPHSVNLMPVFASGTYVPAAGDTVARNQGTNLTAIAEAFGVTSMLVDFNGSPRPQSGPWSIGAFELVSTQPTVTLTVSPARIPLGISATLNWTSLNVTSVVISTFGPVALNGSVTLPTNSGPVTYTATGFGTNGTISSSVTVPALIAPPSGLHTQ